MISLFHNRCGSNRGREVKASDSKSDSLWERRFESCRLRIFFLTRELAGDPFRVSLFLALPLFLSWQERETSKDVRNSLSLRIKKDC